MRASNSKHRHSGMTQRDRPGIQEHLLVLGYRRPVFLDSELAGGAHAPE
jgi:hypothetical protein